jgi:Fic family protein
MSYIENRNINGKIHLYFVKRISLMDKVFVIKKHIGLTSPMFTKRKYILDNLDELSLKELNFRFKFLNQIKKQLSYSTNLPERIELNSIKIDNIIEGKKCRGSLDIEFAKEFIFNSNNIEGSRISLERIREIIEKGDTKYNNRNEVIEVKNSISALEYLRHGFKFNIYSIKRLYHILTKGLFMEGNLPYPKGFKKEDIVVGNSKTTPPDKVAYEIVKLLDWYKMNKNKIHPLILAFEFHRRYEVIHPFRDGNGRTGRLLMNKILMNAGYYPVIVYKENKRAYFNSLEKMSEGKSKKYYQFMLEQADKTYDYILAALKRY